MSDVNNSHQVALITGAARRIGAAIANRLHDAGMNIVVHYRTSEQEALALCARLNQIRHNSAIAISADLQGTEKEATLIEKAYAKWQRLDVLVNNASCFYRTALGTTAIAAWDELMNSNVKSQYFLSQAAADYLKQSNGTIINITDNHGNEPLRDYGVYSISKAAIIMLTKVLAKELGPSIRVNGVSPGAIMWPEGDNTLADSEKEKIIKSTLLKRSGDANDIAEMVWFLATRATYVTGQIIAVDGGRL